MGGVTLDEYNRAMAHIRSASEHLRLAERYIVSDQLARTGVNVARDDAWAAQCRIQSRLAALGIP